MKKKLLALLISFCMLVSLLPTSLLPVMASDEESELISEEESIPEELEMGESSEEVLEEESINEETSVEMDLTEEELSEEELIVEESPAEEVPNEIENDNLADNIDVSGRKATLKGGSKLYAAIGSILTWDVTTDRTVTIAKQYTVNGTIWYKLADNGGIDVYKFVRAEDVEILPESVSAYVSGKSFTVSGDALPAGAELSVSNVASGSFFEALNDGESVVFDIDLTKNGASVEPDGKVRVTISNVFEPFTLEEGDSAYVYVYHFLDDADAIAKAIANGSAEFVPEGAFPETIPASLSKAIDAAVAAGYGRGLVVETIHATVYESGAISFSAGSFSIYTATVTTPTYNMYGDEGKPQNSNGYSYDHEVTMDNHNGDTYYLTRGQMFCIDSGYSSDYHHEWTIDGGSYKASWTDYDWAEWQGANHTRGHENYHELYFKVKNDTSAQYYVKHRIRITSQNALIGDAGDYSIYVYVVPEVTIRYHNNTGNGMAVPGNVTTVLGDGTNVPYTRFQVANPTPPAGYEIAWYTANGTKLSNGSYVLADRTYATPAFSQSTSQYYIDLYMALTPITYNITYVLNGGTNNADNPSTYTIESPTITLKDPTREGYIFTGWTPGNTIPQGSTGDKTFTATWREDSKPYVIHHKSSTGTKLADDTTGTVTTTGSVDVASNKKSFDGYNYTSSTPATITYSNTEATILYTPINYTITYSGLEGATVSGNPTTYNVETATFTLNNPTKTGYTFIGWTGSNGTSAQMVVSVEKGSTGNREYVAKWQINRYDATAAIATGDAGVSTTSGSDTYDYNASVTFGATLKPGYDFIGWFNNAQGTGTALGTNTSYNFTMPDNAVTYYAKTTEQTVDYTYVAVCKDTVPTGTNFGSVSKNAETVGKVTGTPSATATANTPTFRFVGWFDNAAGTGTALSTELTYEPNNKDSNGLLQGGAFYAVFEYNEANYTVKHLLQNTDDDNYTEVEAETIKGIIGQNTAAEAKDYDGFEVQAFTQETVAADGSTVVEIKYNRKLCNYTVKYVDIDTGEEIKTSKESQARYGAVVTEQAPSIAGYDIEEKDGVQILSKQITIQLDEDKNVITFYYKQILGDLTIQKTGCSDLDVGQGFIFHVVSTELVNTNHDPIDMYVTVQGNGSVSIKDLPVGKYKITEDSNWSWRYTASPVNVTLDDDGETATVANSRKADSPYLSSSDFVINKAVHEKN